MSLSPVPAAKKHGGLIAQSVEHRPFKAVVPGSSPGQPTIFFDYVRRVFRKNRQKMRYRKDGLIS